MTRPWIVLGLSSIVSVLFVFAFEQVAYQGRVLRGVWVGGVDLSGFSRAEATARIRALEAERSREALTVTLRGCGFRLDPRLVGLRFDVARTADRALERGRTGPWHARFAAWAKRIAIRSDEAVVGALDDSRLAQIVEGWERQAIAERPFEGGVVIRGIEVIPELPRAGDRVDLGAARSALLGALLGTERGVTVALSTVRVEPALTPAEVERTSRELRRMLAGPVTFAAADAEQRLSLSAEQIAQALKVERKGPKLEIALDPRAITALLDPHRAALETPPKNASFVVSPRDEISIVPSEPGVRIDESAFASELLAAARSEHRTGRLVLTRGAEPALTTEAAEKLGIEKLVYSFTTRHECCQKRVQNIHRIADIMDGTVVLPGETVSVNALVGPRTLKNGFVPAPTIEEGEMVDTPGGGVSQFATTLFNALFHGGYEIIERQPHSYWFSRYPMGHEATLSWPKPDVIFRNDTDAGLLIKTAYTETSITVKLYGNNGGRKVRAEVSPRRDIVEPAVELIPNPKLEPDREKVKEPGMIGWSVIVGRVLTFPDGRTKEERRKVTYRPRVRRVEVHPCRIPEGEPGHTGERCPEPEDVELESEPSAAAE